MERELTLEFVRITEAAALAAAPWIGKNDKNGADSAAVEAMRSMFRSVRIRGTVVIGEGEMDVAPMLYIGENVGIGYGSSLDVAVDPLEGTNSAAKGLENAMSVLAAAPSGHLLHAPDMYMEKLAVGPELVGQVNLTDPIERTLETAARKLNKPLSAVTVQVLARSRHSELVNRVKRAGAQVRLLHEGDILGAIAPALPDSGIDLYAGSGGAPEGVLAAAALRTLGGEIQGRLMPTSNAEYRRCLAMGLRNPRVVLRMEDLVGTEDVVFAATGVTSGPLVKGVRLLPYHRAETFSVVMRASTRTIRYIHAVHAMPEVRLQSVEG